MGRDIARRVLSASEQNYRYFVFVDTGPRFTVPKRYHNLFYSHPGLCDTMVVVLRNQLSSTIPVDTLNMIAQFDQPASADEDSPPFFNRGHTISVISTRTGQLAIDPTYGFVLATKGNFFDRQTFESRNFQIFTLFANPYDAWEERSPDNGLAFYTNLGRPEGGSVAKGGDRLTVAFPVIRVKKTGVTMVGKPDGTNRQLTRLYGGWGNHIGYWYEKSRHVWHFRVARKARYRISFGLIGLGAERSVVLERPLRIEASVKSAGTGKSTRARLLSPRKIKTEENKLNFVVQAQPGEFTLAISSRDVSARLLDYITVTPI